MANKKQTKRIVISGGFDPVNPGHIATSEKIQILCSVDEFVVGVPRIESPRRN